MAEFDAVVQEAVESLPEPMRGAVHNVIITVADCPSSARGEEDDLLGIFVGVPLNERSVFDPPGPPDRIYLFQRNLEEECETHEELVDEIYLTLVHEIGHYLGYDEDELHDLGVG